MEASYLDPYLFSSASVGASFDVICLAARPLIRIVRFAVVSDQAGDRSKVESSVDIDPRPAAYRNTCLMIAAGSQNPIAV